MVAGPVYKAIADAVVEMLGSAGVDAKEVGEIVYVGGTGSLPGLDEAVQGGAGFGEGDEESGEGGVQTPFSRGIVQGGGIGDPTTVLARGCAVQAALLAGLPQSGTAEDRELHDVILGEEGEQVRKVKATTRTVGVLFPVGEEAEGLGEDVKALGGVFVPVVQKETALPSRRVVQVAVGVPAEKRVCLEIWEVKEGIRIEKIKVPLDEDAEEDEEEEEEEEVKHKIISKEVLLGAVELGVKADKVDKAVVKIQFIVGIEGELDVEVSVVEDAGEVKRVHVPAP